MVEVDNLDRLEHADITISSLSSMKDFFESLMESEVIKDKINVDAYLAYLDENLRTIGLDNLLNLDDLDIPRTKDGQKS